MLPLTTADLLAHAIVGSVLENLDMERLVREVGHAVAQRILGNNESVDDVARELHEKLLLRNESTKKVVIESIYKESPESTNNVEVFTNAPSLAEARPLLKKVTSFERLHSVWSDFLPGPWNPLHRQIPSNEEYQQLEKLLHFLRSCYSATFPDSPFAFAGGQSQRIARVTTAQGCD